MFFFLGADSFACIYNFYIKLKITGILISSKQNNHLEYLKIRVIWLVSFIIMLMLSITALSNKVGCLIEFLEMLIEVFEITTHFPLGLLSYLELGRVPLSTLIGFL